jgi:hypothetical protein
MKLVNINSRCKVDIKEKSIIIMEERKMFMKRK